MKVDRICEGKEFCVLNTANNFPPLEELHQMILRHGGKVVQNPSEYTDTNFIARMSSDFSDFDFPVQLNTHLLRSLLRSRFVCRN